MKIRINSPSLLFFLDMNFLDTFIEDRQFFILELFSWSKIKLKKELKWIFLLIVEEEIKGQDRKKYSMKYTSRRARRQEKKEAEKKATTKGRERKKNSF